MKLFAKIGLVGAILAGGAVIYANPNKWLSPSGESAAEVGIQANMSFEELMVRVHEMHDHMRGDYRHMEHLQALARRQRDIIKLNCVNDKLVQVKPQLNIADQAENEIQGSLGHRAVALTELVQAREGIERLREEADACIGEPTLTDSSNMFTGPDNPADPYGNPWGSVIEPPAYASPFN